MLLRCLACDRSCTLVPVVVWQAILRSTSADCQPRFYAGQGRFRAVWDALLLEYVGIRGCTDTRPQTCSICSAEAVRQVPGPAQARAGANSISKAGVGCQACRSEERPSRSLSSHARRREKHHSSSVSPSTLRFAEAVALTPFRPGRPQQTSSQACSKCW